MPKKYDWEAIGLRRLYLEEGLSIPKIAAAVGTDNHTVLKAMKRLGIPRRSLKEVALRGADHPSFRGGKTSHGYLRSAIGGKPRKVHRMIAEQVLERHLLRTEAVHHSNRVKDDNRPINLWVFPTCGDHDEFHKNGTIHPQTIFLGAEVVMSYGFPWNHPWKIGGLPCS
jgi:hypothetical protein